MAVAGLGVAAELGISVPTALSLLAFDDSQLCEITNPSLTALHRDVVELGAAAAELLLEVVDGRGRPEDREGVLPMLIERGSTGLLMSSH
jgi:DNA-binding LacI/PurR family transcriptional regulator